MTTAMAAAATRALAEVLEQEAKAREIVTCQHGRDREASQCIPCATLIARSLPEAVIHSESGRRRFAKALASGVRLGRKPTFVQCPGCGETMTRDRLSKRHKCVQGIVPQAPPKVQP